MPRQSDSRAHKNTRMTCTCPAKSSASGQRHFSLPLACNSMYIPSGHMQEWPLLGRPIHKNGQTGVLELVAQALVPWRKLCEKICKTRGEKKNIVKLDRKRWRHWWIDTLRSMTPGSRLAMVNSPVPRFLSAIKIPCAFQSSQYMTFLKTATAKGCKVWS